MITERLQDILEDTARRIDLSKWFYFDKVKPKPFKLVRICDASGPLNPFADFEFHAYWCPHDGYFYWLNGKKACAAITITYWRPLTKKELKKELRSK